MTNHNAGQVKTGTEDPLDFLDSAIAATSAMQETEAPTPKKSHMTNADKALAAQANIYHTPQQEGEIIIMVDPDLVDRNPYQNRRFFNKRKITSLAQSIKENGQLQPCLVRKVGSRYQLALGERRLRACKEAGLQLAVSVDDISNEQMLSYVVAENEERDDTSLIEKYLGIQELLAEGKSRDEAIAVFKVSPSTYTRLLKLNLLPIEMLDTLADSLFAEALNSVRISEIGGLFRDFPDSHDILCDMLKKEIEDFNFQEFDTDTRQADETNKAAAAFVVKAKKLLKPKLSSSTYKPEVFDYSYAQKTIGEGKLTQKSFSLNINKENLPNDVFNSFVAHVNEFFSRLSADPAE